MVGTPVQNRPEIPREFYDVKILFPHLNQTEEKLETKEIKRWLFKSAFTTSTVGLLAKFWLTCEY